MGNWLRLAATNRSQDRWRHERSCVGRQLHDRRLVGVELFRVAHALLLRLIATMQLLESGDRSAFWSIWAFLRRQLPTVAADGTQPTWAYMKLDASVSVFLLAYMWWCLHVGACRCAESGRGGPARSGDRVRESDVVNLQAAVRHHRRQRR